MTVVLVNTRLGKDSSRSVYADDDGRAANAINTESLPSVGIASPVVCNTVLGVSLVGVGLRDVQVAQILRVILMKRAVEPFTRKVFAPV